MGHKTYWTDTINALKNDKGFNYQSIHISGHATIDVLIEFARKLAPKKIVPIHTENPEKFKEEFLMAGITNVEIWEDGKVYDI